MLNPLQNVELQVSNHKLKLNSSETQLMEETPEEFKGTLAVFNLKTNAKVTKNKGERIRSVQIISQKHMWAESCIVTALIDL